jgi:hypothetical protein
MSKLSRIIIIKCGRCGFWGRELLTETPIIKSDKPPKKITLRRRASSVVTSCLQQAGPGLPTWEQIAQEEKEEEEEET